MYPAMIVLITAVVTFWASIVLDTYLIDEAFGDDEVAPFLYYAIQPWRTLQRLWALLS